MSWTVSTDWKNEGFYCYLKLPTTKSSAMFSKAKGYLLQNNKSVLLDHKKEWVKCKLCGIIVDS